MEGFKKGKIYNTLPLSDASRTQDAVGQTNHRSDLKVAGRGRAVLHGQIMFFFRSPVRLGKVLIDSFEAPPNIFKIL